MPYPSVPYLQPEMPIQRNESAPIFICASHAQSFVVAVC